MNVLKPGSRDRNPSHVQDKSELEEKKDMLGPHFASSDEINIFETMKKETRLLKLCNHREKSHWRIFYLNNQKNCIHWKVEKKDWKTDKKDLSKRTIYIHDMIEIVTYSNQNISKFEKTLPDGLEKTDLQPKQFTIKYFDNDNSNNNHAHAHDGASTPSAAHNELKLKGGHFTLRGFNNHVITPAETMKSDTGILELHLMAQDRKTALIWITGLRSLIKYVQTNDNLMETKDLKILTKDLYLQDLNSSQKHSQSVNIGNGISDTSEKIINEKNKKNLQIIEELKFHLIETNNKFQNLIQNKLPEKERRIIQESDTLEENIIVKKCRRNDSTLRDYLEAINKNQSIPLQSVKSMEYNLKRIDMDIGALLIAIQNKKEIMEKEREKFSKAKAKKKRKTSDLSVGSSPRQLRNIRNSPRNYSIKSQSRGPSLDPELK